MLRNGTARMNGTPPATITAARRNHRNRYAHVVPRPAGTMTVYRFRHAIRLCRSHAGKACAGMLSLAVLWFVLSYPHLVGPAGWLLLAGMCCAGARAGWAIADAVILWPHRQRWVNPLGRALRPILDYGDHIPATKFIRWPRDFGAEHTAMRIVLPREYVGSDDDRKELVCAVREVGGFGEGDLNHKFVVEGPFSFLQVTPREKKVVPNRVSVPEVQELLDAVVTGHPLMALGKGNQPILGDLDGDAPHVGVSMRTGKGKSNTIRGIVAQEMHLGASVVICDLKRRSHRWARGLEGVTYCRDVGEIHNALIRLAKEADQRNRLADELDDDQEPPWQRRILVMEEQNSTLDELTNYWQEIREPGDPKVSPAIRSYRAIGNMGRQVKVHIIAAFQKLTAQAAGGTVARDNFGMIIMSGFKPGAWKMLAEELPMPNIAGKPKGRSWFVYDGQGPEGQTVLWTEKETREWAASGKSSRVVAGGATPVSQGKRPARVAGSSVLTVIEGERDTAFLTIREASSDKGRGIVQATYQTLRGKRVTDPEFPSPERIEGQSKLYRAETLQRWERNREAAG